MKIFAVLPSIGWLLIFSVGAICQETAIFSDINIDIPGFSQSATSWGDYDGDGDLDIIITGSNLNETSSKIFRNDGNLLFTEITANISGVLSGSVDWGDYDNDGDLDFILIGWDGMEHICEIYNNIGNDLFEKLWFIDIPGVSDGSVDWGDCDNDGDLDLLITGWNGNNRFSAVYRNNGYHTFSLIPEIDLTGVDESCASWCDYDGDRDLDIILAGNGDINLVALLYENDGTGFFSLNPHTKLIPVTNSSVAWGDYDQDGDFDIMLAGWTGSNHIAQLYKNSGGGIFELEDHALIKGLSDGTVSWADYDNDGSSDILITGQDSLHMSLLYHNDGEGYFSLDSNANFVGVAFGSACWGDFDNDGRLDLLISGMDNASNSVTKLYKNEIEIINAPPTVPWDLRSTVVRDSVLLRWRTSYDDKTPRRALNYNIRVGTSPTAIDIFPPHANSISGYRRIVAMGNTQQKRRWHVKDLLPGTYYWSVQCIDNAFNGSLFAVERTFTIAQYAPPPVIKISKGWFSAALPTHSMTIDTLTIFNMTEPGALKLNWHFRDDDCEWLIKNPTGGYVTAGASQDIQLISISDSIRGEFLNELVITGNDPEHESLHVPVLLSVVNSDPQIISLPVTGINEDELYTYLVEAIDWDGDRINIHLEEAPIWLTLNLETWILGGVPAERDVGVDTVVLQVSDSLGGINRQVFFLTVYAVNDPPKIIQEIPGLQFQEDDSLEYKIADLYQYVEDPDDTDTLLNYNIKHGRYVSAAPKDSTISIQAPINWCGRDTLKLIVSDGEFSDSTDVHVVVTPVNDAPYFVNWPDTVQCSNTSPHVIIMGEYVQDPDLPYDQLNWTFTVSDEILIYQFYPKTTALILGAPEFEGIVKLYCRVIDNGSASIIDSFYVKIVDEITSTADLTNDIPNDYGLEQNYPNPFNSSTTIGYALPENGEVILEIYNSLGQKIATLLSARLAAGYYQVAFNVQNLPSGIYFYRMQVGPFQDIKKMLVVK